MCVCGGEGGGGLLEQACIYAPALQPVNCMGSAGLPQLPAGHMCRGDFGVDVGRNIIHGSDSIESAQREIVSGVGFLCVGPCWWGWPGGGGAGLSGVAVTGTRLRKCTGRSAANTAIPNRRTLANEERALD